MVELRRLRIHRFRQVRPGPWVVREEDGQIALLASAWRTAPEDGEDIVLESG